MKRFFTIAAIMSLATASSLMGKEPFSTKNMELFFQSGFEKDCKVVKGPDSTRLYMTGIDHSLPDNNDWSTISKSSGPIQKFSFNLDKGDSTQRYVSIVPDPENPKNNVLAFNIYEPHINAKAKDGVAYKARVQADVITDKTSEELYHSVRMLLDEEMSALRFMPEKIHWFTIAEWWNNPPRTDRGYTFRISVDIVKEEGANNDLYFQAKAQNYVPFDPPQPHRIATGDFTNKWVEVGTKFKVPFGKWMTLEYYLKKGNAETGRFCMTVTPDGGEKIVLFDITGDTYGTGNPNPSGVVPYFSPMKLYTSAKIANFMKDNSYSVSVYWDDLKIWRTPVDK